MIDYFHWEKQGDWKFDPVYWPDPDAMIQELKEMGVELMVSVWPTVDPECENYNEKEKFWIKELNTLAPNGYNLQGTGYANPGKNKSKIP